MSMKPEPIADDDAEKRKRILTDYLRQTGKTGVIAVAIDDEHDISFAIVCDGVVCDHMLEYLHGILDVAKVMIRPYGDYEPAADQMPEAHQSSKGPH